MKDWVTRGVVYQIYPRSFCDSNGDGIGDLQGIISKLDHLKELGVDILWLSPVYRSPNDDNGYDISDYRAIHPDFGTMADMEELIARARDMGMRVIMDLVINHTSDEHEWFVKSKTDPLYRDYYFWREGKTGTRGERLPPNNWTSFFGGPAWDYDAALEKWYLHLFSKKQPDLNWGSPDVYAGVVRILKFWLDKGIAGFRCDVINVISKESLADGIKRVALVGREHYLAREGFHEIMRRLRKDVFDHYDCFTVGETVMATPEMAGGMAGEERGELDMVFSFEHMECDCRGVKWFKKNYKPANLIRALVRWQLHAPRNALYFENHDQPRSVSRFAAPEHREQAAKLFAGLLLTLRGTPYIYEGEEIGMTNCDFKDLSEIQDVESHTIYKTARSLHLPAFYVWRMIQRSTRDHARTPMQWNARQYAGFSSARPWLKVNENYTEINAASERANPAGVFAFYKQLLQLRKNEEALYNGTIAFLPAPEGVLRYQRKAGGAVFTAAANLNKKAARLKTPLPGVVTAGNYPDTDRHGSRVLRPYEFILMKETH